MVPVHISGVLAGVESSPFLPEINQLGAVANILSSADIRVAKTMDHPPDPCFPPDPCKGLNGAVNRLEAINDQIGSIENIIFSMINEVTYVQGSTLHEMLIPPLEDAHDLANVILVRIGEYRPTDPAAPEFLEALENVADSAFLLMGTVDESIVRLSELMACEYYDTETACSAAGCWWDIIGVCLPIDS